MKSSSQFRWGRVLFAVSLAVGILFLSLPMRSSPKPETRNLKAAVTKCMMIHRAMSDFVMKYGRFPSPETIDEVRKSTSTSIPLGTDSSNAYLRQLIATGTDEKMFDFNSKKLRRPDGRVDGKHALEKGECGFAYVVGVGMSDPGAMPVVICPVIPGEKRFDPKPFGKRVLMLRMDGSVTTQVINIHGHIALGGGESIDPAKPEWEGIPLTIAWPE